MKPLAKLMVAPNGARRTKADHPAIPVTIEETVACAKACFQAGATALHAHVRDADQRHILDAGMYRELIAEMHTQVPDMDVQITTEAVGVYSAAEQRKLVADVMPPSVSVALTEMTIDNDMDACRRFYHMCFEAQIPVQHILYSADAIPQMLRMIDKGIIPAKHLQLMLVLGRYTKNQESQPLDLDPFLTALSDTPCQWAVCAFGKGETPSLVYALEKGGCVRIGFENSLWHADGSLAKDNAERVATIAELIKG